MNNKELENHIVSIPLKDSPMITDELTSAMRKKIKELGFTFSSFSKAHKYDFHVLRNVLYGNNIHINSRVISICNTLDIEISEYVDIPKSA